ncbi:hypothetical protein AUR64_19385 [Haloprofundus marisrubri]|uniref:Glycosyltransferase RgtA/B/C/D-like domain-containing protein n=1 Tax=Haloprofundus marisrubri TaxID=1514971 RepID=A0A0W1R592_9EURY|nr:hypothetical protein [Haloprofundus marisrubri]KTG08396.1 hypothetical protein AUR64_19385 [Haloprofundus marisrubri]
MSMGSVSDWLRARRFDVDAAVLALIAALAMVPLRLLFSQVYVETIPLVLGGAAILYLLSVYSSRGENDEAAFVLPVGLSRLLPSVVVLGTAGMLLAAVLAGERGVAFYAVAGVTGTLLLSQILFAKEEAFNPSILLLQVVLVAGTVRFAAIATTPGFIGIDIWTHLPELTSSILEAGSLDAISDDKHYVSPLYHLLVASSSLIYDVPLRTALYLSLGLVIPLSPLLVYMATRELVAERWAVLAAALFSFGDYVIEWGMHIIPTSMGLVIFLAVLYALIRLMQTDYAARDFALLAGLSVALILTHQVSSFIMLVVFGGAVVAYFLLNLGIYRVSRLRPDVFRARNPVNILGLVVFDVGLITFLWSFTPYKGGTFLETILSFLAETVSSSAGFGNLAGGASAASASGGESAGASTPLVELAGYIDVLGFLLLLLGTFVGCLYVVHRDRAKQSVFTLLIGTAIMLVFTLGLPMFGIRNFIPQRWFAFMYAPMAILTAVGVRYLAANLNAKILVAGLLVAALVFPGAMVVSRNGTLDNPVLPAGETLSYDEQSVAAVDTIGQMTGGPEPMEIRPDQQLRTDHPYQTVFKRTGAYTADTANVTDGQPVDHDVVVYREFQSDGTTYFMNGDGYGQVRNIPQERICRPGQSTLYDNGDVTMCVTPSENSDS